MAALTLFKRLSAPIFPENIDATYQNLKISIFGHFVLSLLCVWLLNDTVPQEVLYLWLFTILGLNGVRAYTLSQLFLTKSDSPRPYLYTWIMLLIGLVWGGISLITVHYASALEHLFITVVIAGLSAGAVATVSPIFSAFVGFFICAVFPVFISFLISPEPLLRATSPVILFYLFVVFSAGKQLHNNLLNSIKLQKESAALNQQLELEKARAEQANQAKTRFISSMTHELKTPLNAIMGFSQLLALNEHLSEDDKDNVEQIDIASQQLLHLINNIFKLSDLVSDKRPLTAAPVILDEVVSNVMPLIQTQANERNVTLSLQIADDPILADQSALEEVLFQLLTNAIQHSPLGGQVTLYSELSPNNKVRVSIQDTGEGIAEKYHADVFKAFNRLGKEAKTSAGMGTGLYFSKIHIEKMLGTIGFDSQEGEGSTFWFELNLAKTQTDD